MEAIVCRHKPHDEFHGCSEAGGGIGTCFVESPNGSFDCVTNEFTTPLIVKPGVIHACSVPDQSPKRGLPERKHGVNPARPALDRPFARGWNVWCLS